MTEAALNNRVDVDITTFLTLDRVEVRSQITSKKRLMESVANLLIQGDVDLDRKLVLNILNERERLGSTGIGNGVALPHGRVEGISEVIGAAMMLATPIAYDAMDHQPVQLVFGLLVPIEATDRHLQILAHLAKLFSDADLRAQLLNARVKEKAFELLSR